MREREREREEEEEDSQEIRHENGALMFPLFLRGDIEKEREFNCESLSPTANQPSVGSRAWP